MKFHVTMKDPDTLHDAIRDAVTNEVRLMPGLSKDEKDLLIESRSETVRDLCKMWFKWGEYLTVEIDPAWRQWDGLLSRQSLRRCAGMVG